MRNSTSQRAQAKLQSLNKILDAGAKRLCSAGLEGAAIALVMHDAGLTHGAFYSHFSDRDDFSIAAFVHAIRSRRHRWVGGSSESSWGVRLLRLARGYLSRAHRDGLSESCAFAALTADSGRASAKFREAYERELRDTVAAICKPFEANDADGKHPDDALVLMALCIGGMSLARAIPDRKLSDQVLHACRNAFAARALSSADFRP